MALKYRVYSTGNDYSITTVVTGLTLERIVHKIGGPIAEEQVWALCHQCCVSLSNSEQFLMRPVTAKNTVLTIEGEIKLLSASGQTENNRTIGKALNDIGLMLFTLLDYGLDENVERPIAPSLEKLIEILLNSQFTATTSPISVDWSDDITDDCTDSDTESMRDSTSPVSRNSNGSFYHVPADDILSVVKICRYHVENVADPFLYYQNICISLIEEVIDLINLNRRFSSSVSEDEKKKRETNWCCVMSDIKKGIKLKHVASLKENDALVLSDLEKFLISVTKFNKASLKSVMQYGSPSRRPSLPFELLNARKKVDSGNTHDSIMKGILSKPKLKPVSDRVNYSLASHEVILSPREMLMNDIQRSRRLRKVHRSSLKRIFCYHDKSQSLSCMPSAIMAEQEDSSNLYNSLQPNNHLTLTDMQPLSVSYSGRDEFHFEAIAQYNNDPNDSCYDLQSPLPPLINSIITSNGIAFIETKPDAGNDFIVSSDWLQNDDVFYIEDRMVVPSSCLNGYTSPPFNVTGNDGNRHDNSVCQKEPSSLENHQNGHCNIMNTADQKCLTKQVSVSLKTLSSPSHYISKSFSRLLSRTGSKRLKSKQSHYYTSNWSLDKNIQYEDQDNLESDSSCNFSQDYIFASDSVDNEEIEDVVSKNEDIELLGYSSMPLSDIISIQSTLANTTLHNIELTDNKLFRDLDTGKLCFQCHKKFRFMSQPHNCYICQRKVCVNCLVKDISSIKFCYLRPSKKSIKVCASCKTFLKDQLR